MLINSIADFAVQPLSAVQSDAAFAPVRAAILDTVGCIVAGRNSPATQIAAQWAAVGLPPGGEATVLFGSGRASPRHAAFVNAVAAHALELDDAGLASHPSSVLVPVIWAEAERGSATGRAITDAYAKAYQVWWDLHRRYTVALHTVGWHPTAVFGALAGVVAVAALRRLDTGTTRQALGIAASLSGGVVANFGTMTKPIQVGFAAERALTAADLATAGVTSSPNAIEGPGGLLAALDQNGPIDADGALRTTAMAIVESPPSVKKYPVCFASHRVIDGLLDLLEHSTIAPDDVDRIVARISTSTAAVLEQGMNDPAGEAQFSLPFAVAATVLHGRLGLAEVEEVVTRDQRIRDLMSKVTVATTDSADPREPSFALADRIQVFTTDGVEHDSGEIRYVRGSAEQPLNPRELEAKVYACLDFGEPDPVRAREIAEMVTAVLNSHDDKEHD